MFKKIFILLIICFSMLSSTFVYANDKTNSFILANETAESKNLNTTELESGLKTMATFYTTNTFDNVVDVSLSGNILFNPDLNMFRFTGNENVYYKVKSNNYEYVSAPTYSKSIIDGGRSMVIKLTGDIRDKNTGSITNYIVNAFFYCSPVDGTVAPSH